MKKLNSHFIFLFFLCLFAYSCKEKNDLAPMNDIKYTESQLALKSDIVPPIAEKEESILEKHGDERKDNYYWMKLSDEQKLAEEPDEPTQKVLDYLNAENDYTKAMTSHLVDFQDSLYNEIIGRIKQDDASVPYRKNGYYYITKYEKGNEYPVYSRKKESLDNQEEVMLNVNELATDYEYYHISGRSVSPNNSILAFGQDTLSRRQYTLRFKNLETGEFLEDKIHNTTGGCTWANDNKTVYYTRKDDALRSYKIFKHIVGTDASQDVEVYHEEDDTFGTYVYKSKSNKYIIIGSYSTLSQEYRILEADNPEGEFRLFQPREKGLEHRIAHFEDQWYILTNKDEAFNFKVMSTPEGKTDQSNWVDVIPHRNEVFIEDIDLFSNYMAINERLDGISKIRIRPWEGEEHYVDFGEEAYVANMGTNPEFNTDIIRLSFSSLTTPNTVYDYDMANQSLKQMKQQEVLGDFNANDYTTERIMVPARDGKEIPMSIVYKKGFKKNGSQPVLLYAYGSYGYSIDPYFSSVRLSLLDRGFAYAIAHIRGGQELGRKWYEDGKFLKKKNTFTDFIDCGQYLIDEEYCHDDKLFGMGGSAGGLLIGAVVNMAPDLFNGVIAAVPFVDVVTTMLDESIPLTTGEYDEWGNPNDKVYYDYMKSYSPYDNVERKDYPSMLVTTGYHDSQVQYWEPAKWVAKLRDMKTDNNPLLLHTNMGAGHGGASGRFQKYKETALEYAFMIDLAGLKE